ncbi:MAG: nucleotidyltransferase domain-containing protein [Candidatus Omnitrophota bacterium]
MKDVNKLKSGIIKIIDQFLGDGYLLIVFGSFVKGKKDKASDIDLAVYRDNKISAKLIVQIREELNEKAPTLRQIDLINLTDENINTRLVKNILEQGAVWKKAKNSEGFLRDLKKRLVNIEK